MPRTPAGSSSSPPTMIIPNGAEVRVDDHQQLSIRTPGNLVIQQSGRYGTIEATHGSIRIESGAAVEAVELKCGETCFVEGSLTAWKVSAKEIHLEDDARANVVLQETGQLVVGKGARLVGNFDSERELFFLFSRFAQQFRSLPFFSDRPRAVDGDREAARLEAPRQEMKADDRRPRSKPPGSGEEENEAEGSSHLPDELFFALVLLERDVDRPAYGPTSRRVVQELIKLLRGGELEALRLTYRTLFGGVTDPSQDTERARELIRGHFEGGPEQRPAYR